MQTYIVTSDRLPYLRGKVVTEAQLVDLGANVEVLLAGGHISPHTASKPAKTVTPAQKD